MRQAPGGGPSVLLNVRKNVAFRTGRVLKRLAMVLQFVRILLLVVLSQHASCTPLDDYVSKNDSHFSWFDTGARISTEFGGYALLLLSYF